MEVIDNGYVISIRIKLKDEFKNDRKYVEEIAEDIKDMIYDYDEITSPIEDVTYTVEKAYKEKEYDKS